MSIYILLFMGIVCIVLLVFGLFTSFKIEKQNENLKKEKKEIYTLLKNVTFNKTLDAEIAVLEYFKRIEGNKSISKSTKN